MRSEWPAIRKTDGMARDPQHVQQSKSRARLNPLHGLSASTTSRFALWLLIGSLLIPLSTTTLRGLHHLVSCIEEVDQTFSVQSFPNPRSKDPNDRIPLITGSTSVVRQPPTGKCAAVEMNMRVSPDRKGFIVITLPVNNLTDRDWVTSVILQLDGLKTSVPVGRIPAGQQATKQIRVRLTQDLRSITGTLIVGP
jgi:hypothetical protein